MDVDEESSNEIWLQLPDVPRTFLETRIRQTTRRKWMISSRITGVRHLLFLFNASALVISAVIVVTIVVVVVVVIIVAYSQSLRLHKLSSSSLIILSQIVLNRIGCRTVVHRLRLVLS